MTSSNDWREKWRKTGEMLKSHQPAPKKTGYEDMPKAELEQKKATAEIWLKENHGHPNYAEALRRYEEIVDILTIKDSLF